MGVGPGHVEIHCERSVSAAGHGQCLLPGHARVLQAPTDGWVRGVAPGKQARQALSAPSGAGPVAVWAGRLGYDKYRCARARI